MITSPARWPSRTMRCVASRASWRFGGSLASHRREALPLIMIAASGWLISWAIEAAIWPRVLTRDTWARLRRMRSSASSERLRSVTSMTAPTNSRGSSGRARAVGRDLEMLDGAVRKQEPVFEGEVLAVADRELRRLLEEREIRRVHPLADHLHRWPDGRIEPVDPVGLLRPDDCARRGAPRKAAGEAQALRLRQMGLAPPQGVLRLRPLDGDAGQVPELLDGLPILLARGSAARRSTVRRCRALARSLERIGTGPRCRPAIRQAATAKACP